MCDECGCGDPHGSGSERTIDTSISIRAANDAIASSIRTALGDRGILVVNVMGAPGSGKTTLIERLAPLLGPFAVIQGDLESDIDTRRLVAVGIRAYQINTHSGCHLTAEMVNRVLLGADLSDVEYLLIENVGNLVCPAGVPVGEHVSIVVSSTTEGSDKPAKYPHIFRDARLVVLTKTDIADAVGFDEQSYRAALARITHAKVMPTASKDTESYAPVAAFLKHRRDHLVGRPHEH